MRERQYVALLRGIMPMNPNHRNDKVRAVFEGLGFSNVQSVIASGNIVFETSTRNASLFEKRIEQAISDKLGIYGAVMVRSREDLEALVAKDPFKGKTHGKASYLIVTFLKKTPREIATVVDVSKGTPEFMRMLEKKHGKEITTRTWKTVGRILEKMRKVD